MDSRFVTPVEFKRASDRAELAVANDCGLVRAVSDASATGNSGPITFVASTAAVDRYGDTIAVEGWDLSNFARNPVMPWCHNTYMPPVGRWVDWRITDDALELDGEFMPPDIDGGFGNSIGEMYRRGFLAAVSVGFQPRKYSFNEERSGSYGMPGVDYEEQELLECSPVVVPANQEALMDGKGIAAPFQKAASAGINMRPVLAQFERCLDEGKSGLWLPRAAVESIRKALSTPKIMSLPAAPAKEKTVGRKTIRLAIEVNEEHAERAMAELQKKAKNLGGTVVKGDGDGDADDAPTSDAYEAFKGLMKDFAGKVKDLGEHVAAAEKHAKTMGQQCDDLGEHLKTLKDMADGDGPDAKSGSRIAVEKGGAPHKLSSANYKDLSGAHAALTKVLKRHDGQADDGDGDEDEGGQDQGGDDGKSAEVAAQKALEDRIAALKKTNDELMTRLTGRVA